MFGVSCAIIVKSTLLFGKPYGKSLGNSGHGLSERASWGGQTHGL